MARLAPVVIDGRYELQRKLGRGGVAEVYLARDQKLDRAVAVKVLFPALASDPGFVERFRAGAQAAAALDHPNIVTVYDWGEANGRYYVVMEHVEGDSLADVIAREGRLTPQRAAEIAVDVASALGFAQRDGGVIHRDVKPANVLVTREGGVKVTDFDVPRPAGDAAEGGAGAGAGVGADVEPAAGAGADGRGVHSLGAALYEMLVGQPPLAGADAVAAPRRVDPTIPATLEAIVLKSLAKDPAIRYPSTQDMRSDLRRYLEGARIGAKPTAAPIADPDATEIQSGVDHTAPTETMQRTRVVPPSSTATPGARAGGSGEDGDEDDGSPRPYAVLIVLVVVLVVMAAFLILVTRGSGSGGDGGGRPADGVTVPRVIGMHQADAEAALDRVGLVATIETAADDTVPVGDVVDQDPAANTSLAPGSAVTLTVSSGPASIAVPDLKGKTRDEAMQALTDLAFVPSPKEVPSDTVAVGMVVDTNPPAGTQAARGATVEILVSAGPTTTALPDVTGQPEAQARATLEGAGFTVSSAPQPDPAVPPGTVITTNPAPGSMVANGSAVTLVVSAGGAPPGAVPVPDTMGQNENDARNQLQGAGFQVATIDQPVDGGEWNGRVLAQNPPGGTPTPPGSVVTLVIGRSQGFNQHG
jgi:serine/threonine-protein kinase